MAREAIEDSPMPSCSYSDSFAEHSVYSVDASAALDELTKSLRLPTSFHSSRRPTPTLTRFENPYVDFFHFPSFQSVRLCLWDASC